MYRSSLIVLFLIKIFCFPRPLQAYDFHDFQRPNITPSSELSEKLNKIDNNRELRNLYNPEVFPRKKIEHKGEWLYGQDIVVKYLIAADPNINVNST